MLYVFIVTSGDMIQLDMNFAVKKVSELKKEISRKTNFPVEDLILLCSGGEELVSENMVGNYHGAGTDTNPIYLFCKYKPNREIAPSSRDYELDPTIAHDVLNCETMAPSIGSLNARSTLAQRLVDCAMRGKKECNTLVLHQHLQQQGWAVVVANLEDAKDVLVKRKQHFDEIYQKYLDNRESYREIINGFPNDILLLSKLPLLDKLIDSECLEDGKATKHTLLSWFCTEPLEVLESLVEKLHRSLDELNESTWRHLDENMKQVLKSTEVKELRELIGIENNLTHLGTLKQEVEDIEKDQIEASKVFLNQAQFQHARDPYVLPSVCETFQNQLNLLLKNHKCLEDILTRCSNAKKQLCEKINLHVKIISQVENEMYEQQMKIIFFEKHIKSVESKVESFRQVHMAPERYLKILAEVCRRKEFSASYMKWATELSFQVSKLYNKEFSIRQEFTDKDKKNMVDNLFPGMEDEPPSYAVECPQPFDQNLPDITKEDIEWLKTQFPELSKFCEVLPPEAMPHICTESDSAFSSNIPSSLKNVSHIFEATDLCEKTLPAKGESSSFKVIPPSTDLNSLPSEYASLPNEMFSLASSPFEDPILPNSDLEIKRTKSSSRFSGLSVSASMKEVIVEERSAESDGEEFETVDPCRSYPVDIVSTSSHDARCLSCPRPTSSSDAVTSRRERGLRVTRARSDGDAVSPVQERLKSSDSMLASTDFQSTEYYIDDSMPSSYTESNATSPLMRGNRMVKSHHVLVAELQRQVEEKNDALASAAKLVEEVHSIRSILLDMKTYVKEEMNARMSVSSDVIEKIGEEIQNKITAEKEASVAEARNESNENYIEELRVKSEKLGDAEKQVSYYKEQLSEKTCKLEEIKQENTKLTEENKTKGELITKMMLEHEIEFDSVKKTLTSVLEQQDSTIAELNMNFSKAKSEVEELRSENARIRLDCDVKTNEYQEELRLLQDKFKTCDKKLNCLQFKKGVLEGSDESEEEFKVVETDDVIVKVEKISKLWKLAENTIDFLREKMEERKQAETELINQLDVSHNAEKELMEKLKDQDKEIESLNRKLKENHNTEKELVEKLKEQTIEIESLHSKHQEFVAAATSEVKAKTEIENVENTSENEQEQTRLELLQKVHGEEMEKLKSRITAENQVSFNEAINRLSKEKDSTIDDLKSQISNLEASLNAIKSSFDKFLMSNQSLVMAYSDASAACSKVSQPEEQRLIQKLKVELLPLFKALPASTPPHIQSSQHNLESVKKKFKAKEMEYQRIISKCITPTDCSQCCTKLSILTCDKDDLILLCYDEKYRNFIVFHLGPFVHFLHTDSMQAMNLKIPAFTSESAGPSTSAQSSSQTSSKSVEPSQRWAIGVVEDKEFCITKKKGNRYNVPVGTKFHRVKVRPWDREAGTAVHQCHRSFQMGASSSAAVSKSISARSPSDDGSVSSKDMSASSI